MSSIIDFVNDKSFLIRAFAYLESCHSICTVVLDQSRQIDLRMERNNKEYPEKRFYAAAFEEDIGGIRCSAETVELLEQADPHIRFVVDALNNILDNNLILQQTMDEMLRLSDQLHFLFGLATKLAGIQDIGKYCRLVLEEISTVIGADVAFIYVKRERENPEIVTYKSNRDQARRIYFDPAIQSFSTIKTAVLSLTNESSALITPIEEKGHLIGHMVFVKEAGKHAFSSYDKQLASIINNTISPTIETLALYHSLHVLYLNTVKALAAAIDAKDAYTHGHSFRVAKYSVAIGKQLNIPKKSLADLEVAAYMHDLGKIGVSEAILGKKGKLSPEEFKEIKKHPLLTNKILEPIDLPDFIIDATLQHHERMNGQGYPLGLKGDNISFFARIIAVADVFDALTSVRPYRGALTVEDALTMICNGIDTEFDRNVVHAFVEALRNKASDRELASVCSELKFMHIDQMNSFLERLTPYLIDAGTDFVKYKPINAIT
jgi:HD-GYP domain-containing protein (c-di-GMP phosphodiesterase class II)